MRAPWLILAEKRLTQCLQFEQAQPLHRLLEGQTLLITVQSTNLLLAISVENQKVALSHQPPKKATAKLSGELNTLLKLLKNPKQRQVGILLEGDLAVLEGFSALMALASQNWEELLTPYLGDVFTHHLSKGLKKLKSYTKEHSHAFKLDLKDYLQEEIQLLPTKEEVNHFMEQVDALKLDTERLLAQFEHWNKKNRDVR